MQNSNNRCIMMNLLLSWLKYKEEEENQMKIYQNNNNNNDEFLIKNNKMAFYVINNIQINTIISILLLFV